uniref:Uncharacterized protein n=1 Tax=Plectus sambesii TaxID=2011161 RepID=A0A914XHV2_9BILA
MAAAQSKDIASLQEELKAADVSLRTHQLEGIEFMLKCRRAGHGCILADEMGLGKTCQAVVMLSHLSRSSGGRHLILCPLSVIDHWQNELKRFGADRLVVITYRGDKSEREELRDEIAQRKDWHILLTTYELFLKDHEMLPIHKWQSLTVDEAHRLKNSASLLYQALGEEKFDWVMLLTGTPVQNNLTELYSLIMMIDKVKFPAQGADSFVNKYSDSSNPKTMGGLRQLLDEYLLRRTKDVVCPDLPAKSDIVLYHTISAVQKDLYRAILAKNYNYFEKDSKAGGSTVSLNNVLMQLRKCVIHPYLFEGVEPEPFEEGEHLVEASGKLVVLDLLLQYLHAHKHKVLLFSQMTRALDILQDYLSFRGYSYERLDGSVRGEERFAAVKSFNEKESDTFAFLLSTKAGGLGLTLTAADTVVFLDSDFNPQNDLQAAARAHRIGQNKPVKIIRLIARDTVEEIIQARALGKIHLTNAVIGTASADGSETKLTATEITEMITAGLSRLTTDENSAEARFTNEILINILGGTDDNGCWLPAKDVSPIEEEDGAGEKVESSTQKEPVGSMYFFEGKDYKADAAADETALKAILETAKKNVTAPTSQTARRKRTDGDKADFGTLGAMLDAAKERRPRKILTPEEQAERKQKREQAAALRKQRDEEELVEKEQQRRDRRRSQWAENDYESSNLPEPASAEGGDDVDLDERDCGPFFVLGDVAHPQFRTEHEGADALVLHCVDNSGSWGYGGVFDALLSRSRKVKEVYEWAGEMGDVALGDAHMVDIDDSQSRTSGGRDSAVLLVAQHRKSRGWS